MPAKTGKRKERDEPSAEDKALEEELFGKDITSSSSARIADDDIKFIIDKQPTKAPTTAWHDEDDDEIEVDLNQTDRLKKLKKDNQNIVSGTVFGDALKERFATGKKSWANVAVRETDTVVDKDLELLYQTGSMVTSSKQVGNGSAPLPPGKLDIKRLVNANIAEPSKAAITAVHFHSSGDLMLAAGADKHVRFFKVDGDRNEKQLSVRFNDMAIANARFLGTSAEVVVSGRKPYFYVYDSLSGGISKIPGPMGGNVKSLEDMVVSPEGSRLAFLGSSGHIHIASGRSKTWECDLKMNTSVKTAAFLDETNLVTSGLDADIYLWDLRMSGRCVARFPHDDGSCTSHLSVYTPPAASRFDYHTLSSSYLSVGTESGVVSQFEGQRTSSGLYDFSGFAREQLSKVTQSNGGAVRVQPKQVKTIMNLTTKISVSAYHPSGQILAIASNEKKDQLKLVHLPTHSVFTNWPTDKSPFNRVNCLDFSPGGGYLAVGNNRGKVLLYQLNHFGSA